MAIKFADPGFEPQFCWPPDSLLSSGASPERLRSLSLGTGVERPGFSPGIAPRLLATFYEFVLRTELARLPQPEVSDEFVVGIVTESGAVVERFESFTRDGDRVVRHAPGALVSTYDELLNYLEDDEDLVAIAEGLGMSLRVSTV